LIHGQAPQTNKEGRQEEGRETRRGTTTPQRACGRGVAQHLNAALSELYAQRSSLDAQIESIERTLGEVGAAVPAAPARRAAATPGPGRGRRGPRSGSLKEHIANVLSAAGGVMSVKDITDAVIASGYKSKNKTLGKSVGIALTQMPNVKKVSRGKFGLR
jgi:hypothetical protein